MKSMLYTAAIIACIFITSVQSTTTCYGVQRNDTGVCSGVGVCMSDGSCNCPNSVLGDCSPISWFMDPLFRTIIFPITANAFIMGVNIVLICIGVFLLIISCSAQTSRKKFSKKKTDPTSLKGVMALYKDLTAKLKYITKIQDDIVKEQDKIANGKTPIDAYATLSDIPITENTTP